MGKKNNTKNDEARIADRRCQVARLYVRGCSQHEIARRLGVSQTTVCFDIQAAREEWLATTREAVAEQIAKELAKLDHLEREAWDAWERSKWPLEPKGKLQPGNPEWLTQVRQAVDMRLKCLGAYKTPLGPAVVNQLHIEWDRMFERQPITDPLEAELGLLEHRDLPAPHRNGRNGTHSRTPTPDYEE